MKKIVFIFVTIILFSFFINSYAAITLPNTTDTTNPTITDEAPEDTASRTSNTSNPDKILDPNDPTTNTTTIPPSQPVQNPSYYFPQQQTANYFNDLPTEENATTSISILNSLVNPEIFGNQPLNIILNQLFYIGLIGAVVLAIIMIVRGGIEYMTIDSASGKDTGKRRVQAALGGLVLAFAAILILNTINPGLTRFSLEFSALDSINSIVIEQDIWENVNKFEGLSEQEVQDILASGKIPTDISPTAQKILAQALAAVDSMYTGNIDNTKGGRLACAAAVNKIVELATGTQVGGGLSTAEMYKALQNNSAYVQVPGGVANALPGDIIISPTSGGSTGHVGIIAAAGGQAIISNSSANRKVMQNFNSSSWDRTYGSRKNLPTYIYRPR